MDTETLRRDFPILRREVHGKPLVYLDNAATTQRPNQVVETLLHYYTHNNANIHRGIHLLSEESTEMYEGVRKETAKFIGAQDPHEIIFTRNATESINLIAHAWGNKFIKAGDEIILSEMEHHANIVPWQLLAQRSGAVIKYIPVTEDGKLDMAAYEQLLTPKTKLVSVTHMSNVLGTINPIEEITRLAHASGASVLIDGAQSTPHMPINVTALNCDFFVFSAHKMLGPTGVGVAYGKKAFLESMDPFMGGGDMIRDVRLDGATWNDVPWKFEAGTPNFADTIAFGAALRYLSKVGMENIREHEKALTAYALEQLDQLGGITVYGPRDIEERGGAISFAVDGIHPHDLGQILDEEGVAVRAGHHCCKPLMRKLGTVATTRASVYLYNTEEEIDVFIQALKKAKEVFSIVSH